VCAVLFLNLELLQGKLCDIHVLIELKTRLVIEAKVEVLKW
jgi:hypothetical protein